MTSSKQINTKLPVEEQIDRVSAASCSHLAQAGQGASREKREPMADGSARHVVETAGQRDLRLVAGQDVDDIAGPVKDA